MDSQSVSISTIYVISQMEVDHKHLDVVQCRNLKVGKHILDNCIRQLDIRIHNKYGMVMGIVRIVGQYFAALEMHYYHLALTKDKSQRR